MAHAIIRGANGRRYEVAAHAATRPKRAQPHVRYGHSVTAHERPPAPIPTTNVISASARRRYSKEG